MVYILEIISLADFRYLGPLCAATGAGQLLLLGNGRTDKDQRRGLPKGPYNIGWPQPPPEAMVYSAAPPRCGKASWSHTRLHKVECCCCWSWERKSFPSTERTGEYQRFDNKYKYLQYFFHHCYGVSKRSLRTDAFQFPLHCALVSVRRADKKVLPATLPLTDQLLLRARRTELNFYGQGGNSFHHTLRYGHIGHTPNANPLGVIQQLRGPILTTYPPRVDNCGHFTYTT